MGGIAAPIRGRPPLPPTLVRFAAQALKGRGGVSGRSVRNHFLLASKGVSGEIDPQTPTPTSNPHHTATLDCCAAIMNPTNGTNATRSHRANRSGAKANRQNVSTNSGVNTSGISSDTSQGSQVPTASSAAPGISHRGERAGASIRQTSASTQDVRTACATTTGQVVTVQCKGNMNRL